MKGLIIFLIISGILLFIGFTLLNNKKLEQRREEYNLSLERKSALESYEKTMKTLAKIQDVANQTVGIPAEATNVALSILGAGFDHPLPRSSYSAPPKISPPATASSRQDTTSAQQQPKPNRRSDEAAPFGEPTREELDARRAKRENRQPAPTQPPQHAAINQPEAPPKPAYTPPQPTIAGSPREIQTKTILKSMADRMTTFGNLMNTVQECTLTIDQIYSRIQKPIFSTDAAVLRSKLQEQSMIAANVYNESTNILAEINTGLAKIKELKVEHEAEIVAQIAEQERLRKEAEHRDIVAQERAAAKTLEKQQTTLVKQYKFNEAVQAINTGMKDCKTDEGKAAYMLAAERFGMLQTLKDFLIQAIIASPFHWGWMQNTTNGKDIIKADQQILTITGDTIPWEDVKPPQLKRILQNYIASTDIKLSQRAELHLATAILWRIAGEDATSNAMTAKAREMNPDIAGKIERLIVNDWPE